MHLDRKFERNNYKMGEICPQRSTCEKDWDVLEKHKFYMSRECKVAAMKAKNILKRIKRA